MDPRRPREPHGSIRDLHASEPVCRDAGGAWVVSGFDHIQEVLSDHAHFSSRVMAEGYPLLTDDPPRHSFLRKLLQNAFAPPAISALRPLVERTTDGLISRIEAGVEVEVVAALAAPLPVRAIARVLGVREGSRDRFTELADMLTDQFGVSGAETRARALLELQDWFHGCLTARDAGAGADLIGTLADSRRGGGDLSDKDVVELAILLLTASYETTAHLIGSLLYRLAQERPAWQRLRRRPGLARTVIEEVLRLDSPVQFVPRRALASVTLGGRRIHRGDRVIAHLAVANRDRTRWAAPDAFRADRPRQRHLAFGHGIHFCLGAPLARLQSEVVLRMLLERFSGVEAGEAPALRRRSSLLHGFAKLPLVFV